MPLSEVTTELCTEVQESASVAMKISKLKFRIIAKLPMKELKAGYMMRGCFAGELMSCSMFQGCSACAGSTGRRSQRASVLFFLKISEKQNWKRF